MRGMPCIMMTMTHGIINAPPPFSRATLGNRQTFPNPTANPKHASKYWNRLSYCSLGSRFSSDSAMLIVVVFPLSGSFSLDPNRLLAPPISLLPKDGELDELV